MSTATLGLTPEQLATRKNFVTASEMAAVMGLDPFKTAGDVWALKTGKVENDESGDAAEWGHRIEPALLDWAAGKLETTITRNVWKTAGVLGGTCDAVVDFDGSPLEAKTCGLMNYKALNMAEWGEDGTDEVPDRFLVQVHVQMIVTGAQYAHLAALLAGHGQRLYQIERNAKLCEEIVRQAGAFWQCVTRDTPPAAAPSLETVKRFRRVPGRVVTVRDDVARVFIEANGERKRWEAAEEEAKAELLAAMRDADGSYVEDAAWSGGTFTYRQNKASVRVDAKAMAEAHPILAKQYQREIPGARVLRVKAAAGGGK